MIKNCIAVFGGSFDPIHYGHLRTGIEVYEYFQVNHVRFIPCHTPVHKAAVMANASQRMAMLKLAIREQRGFVVDDTELSRKKTVYTIETLENLHGQFPDHTFLLVIGRDSFNDFLNWHQWKNILQLCHIVVVSRPSYSISADLALTDLVAERRITSPDEFLDKPSGSIYFHDIPGLAISSTRIRQLVSDDWSIRYLTPDPVVEYILSHRLYR